MSTGFGSLSRAMALGFLRDRTALFFTILFPLMFLVLFGGIFKNQSAPKVDVIEVGPVALLDRIPAGQRADLDKVLKIERTNDMAAALEKVRKGDVDAAVEQSGAQVLLHYSAADQVKAGTVRGLFSSLVQSGNLAAAGVTSPAMTLATEPVEDESLKTIQYVTPGLLGWAIATGATFGAALTLVTWRQKKILRRLRLSPVRTTSVIGARVGVSIGIALGQMAIFVGVATLPYFGLRLSHAWWMAVPLVMAGTLAFLSIGLLAGAFAKTAEGASAIANLVVLPMAFLSGAFFPLQAAPAWLQTISQALPLRHLVDAMLDVMVRGQGAASALPAVAILTGFAVVVGGIAAVLFRWDDA
ncbi:MAG: ABC transporter permease [Micromonosporaceae bacterium]